MRGRTPTAAAVLTIVGGLFIVLGGLLEAVFGALVALVLPKLGALLILGGLIVGALTVLMGLLLFALPRLKLVWGTITIALAFLSLVFAFLGGFFIGFLLALVGGVLAVTYRPPLPP